MTWNFSWHYEEIRKDALQKGLSVRDEALLRELVLSKNVGFLSLTKAQECVKRWILAGI
jgi:hypothetical protein